MIRKKMFLLFMVTVFAYQVTGQELVKAEELVNGMTQTYNSGRVRIQQDIRVDSLISRHILANNMLEGMDGFRIQIYRGSHRQAREDANDNRAEFISEFPDIDSYIQFDNPNYFKVRVGNYRTKHDAYPDLQKIRKKFPNAYIVKVDDIIEFPDPE